VLLFSFTWSFVFLFSGSLVSSHSFIFPAFCIYPCPLAILFYCSLRGNVLGAKAAILYFLLLSLVPLFYCCRTFDPLFSRSSISALVSLFVLVIVLSFFLVLLLIWVSCPLVLLCYITLVFLSLCFLVINTRPLHGARFRCNIARHFILSSFPIAFLFSQRKRQVGGLTPPT
jgi:hypothetical protein